VNSEMNLGRSKSMSKEKENVNNEMDDSTEDAHILAIPHMQINGRIKKNISENDLGKIPFKVNAQNSLSIAQEIFTEIGKVGTFITREWNSYLNLFISNSENMFNSLIKKHDAQLNEDFKKFIIKDTTKKISDTDIDKMRINYKKKFRPTIKVQDQRLFRSIENIPMIFEEISRGENSPLEERKGSHLFILVHGFQGRALDMSIFKTYITLCNSEAYLLCSKANEKSIETDISEMGKRLAAEIEEYIDLWFPRSERLAKITFLSHSLGGLVIRAALPLLAKYKDKMWSFISFSSPHLGCAFSESKIVSMGLWLLKKWFDSQSLEQLCLSDKPNPRDCFLYKLSMFRV